MDLTPFERVALRIVKDIVADIVDVQRVGVDKPDITRPGTYVLLDRTRVIGLYEGSRVLSFALYAMTGQQRRRIRLSSARDLYGYRDEIRAAFGGQ